jgi:hypothetical protein
MGFANARLGIFFVLGLLTLTGCAATGGTSRSSSAPLTAEEIQSAPAGNLYEVIDQLRPRWLQMRAVMSFGTGSGTPQIGVFLNRSYLGTPEALRNLSKEGIREIRYLDGPAASAQLRAPGGVGLAGAILVETSGG